ncbi:hypothetical protein HK104_005820 [Borealophlyctis nickersoniae]|nr:hypothetical protein HK104_005820 [Borealophlyctis nickersoniae]
MAIPFPLNTLPVLHPSAPPSPSIIQPDADRQPDPLLASIIADALSGIALSISRTEAMTTTVQAGGAEMGEAHTLPPATTVVSASETFRVDISPEENITSDHAAAVSSTSDAASDRTVKLYDAPPITSSGESDCHVDEPTVRPVTRETREELVSASPVADAEHWHEEEVLDPVSESVSAVPTPYFAFPSSPSPPQGSGFGFSSVSPSPFPAISDEHEDDEDSSRTEAFREYLLSDIWSSQKHSFHRLGETSKRRRRISSMSAPATVGDEFNSDSYIGAHAVAEEETRRAIEGGFRRAMRESGRNARSQKTLSLQALPPAAEENEESLEAGILSLFTSATRALFGPIRPNDETTPQASNAHAPTITNTTTTVGSARISNISRAVHGEEYESSISSSSFSSTAGGFWGDEDHDDPHEEHGRHRRKTKGWAYGVDAGSTYSNDTRSFESHTDEGDHGEDDDDDDYHNDGHGDMDDAVGGSEEFMGAVHSFHDDRLADLALGMASTSIVTAPLSVAVPARVASSSSVQTMIAPRTGMDVDRRGMVGAGRVAPSWISTEADGSEVGVRSEVSGESTVIGVPGPVSMHRQPSIPPSFYRLGVYVAIGDAGGSVGGKGKVSKLISSSYTTYTVTIKLLRPNIPMYGNSSPVTFTIHRRYREFRAFYESMVKKYKSIGPWPEFPRKSFFGKRYVKYRFAHSTISHRLNCFSSLLSFVALHPALYNSPVTLNFFGVAARGRDGMGHGVIGGGVVIYERGNKKGQEDGGGGRKKKGIVGIGNIGGSAVVRSFSNPL